MNGAESLVRTLIACEVEVCFANPGTSEMHLLAALDRMSGIRAVLGLFEGVVTGAADGYARMAGKPAITLLHLGPGLANGLANLHNARRARSPVVNIIGEHATHHRGLQSPLESDVEAVARPFSDWVRVAETPAEVGQAAAAAVAAARRVPGRIASLIVPGDAAWNEGGQPVTAPPPRVRPGPVPEERITAIAALLRSGAPCLLFMTGAALSEAGLAAAGRIAASTGAVPLAQMSNARLERGAGRVPIDRLRYPVDQALDQLGRFRHVVLIGTREPVAFFAYPGKPSRLAPEGAAVHRLAGPEDDLVGALEQLAERVGAPPARHVRRRLRSAGAPERPLDRRQDRAGSGRGHAGGRDRRRRVGLGRAQLLRPDPDRAAAQLAAGDRRRDRLRPAARHRRGARLPGTQGDLARGRRQRHVHPAGALDPGARRPGRDHGDPLEPQLRDPQGRDAERRRRAPGPTGRDMMELDRPALDWPALARGMGVEAAATDDAAEFARLLERGLATPGPFLIEARI